MPQLIGTLGWLLLILALITYYFMLVSGAFINADFRTMVRKTFYLGAKKLFSNLWRLVLNYGLIVASGYLLFFSIETNYPLWTSLLLILVLSLVLVATRIFWIMALNQKR